MIVDTSAILAILLEEREGQPFFDLILRSTVSVSAASYVELAIVCDIRVSLRGGHEMDALLERLRIQIEPVTEQQARIARRAYSIYGKGNHPAALNFGDCFAYALSKDTARPLLFKGEDFGKTDVLAAL